MDLNLIRPFLVVFECQSYTKAADILGVTQPAISASIKRLENEVGNTLFTKLGRGITPTAHAFYLAKHFQTALDDIDQALSKQRKYHVACAETLLPNLENFPSVAYRGEG